MQYQELNNKYLHMKTIKSIVFVSIISFIFGCTKKGDTGPSGKDGSSNVSATVFSISSWGWTAPNYYANLSVPEITSDNFNSAAIMVYFSTSNGKWTALPFTQYNSPSNYFMGFNTSVGNVQVTWIYDSSLSSGSNPNNYYGVTALQCKVVVIPKAAKEAHPNVNLSNYIEVREAFELKD